MGKLQILSPQVANMIAAGEVVGRPASVVKELMENSLDAGATSVSVIITDSGRTLIQVIDDGCGMTPDDARLCFERHATSKISSAQDLESIGTFGFRGEALASIAAVSEVTLKTRQKGSDTATKVEIGSTAEMSVSECQAPEGTNFAIRNLFYNTPARRKFLKSDNIELKHIIDEFTRVALTRPDVSFSLSHNNHDIHVLKKAKSLKFRILDLLGEGVVGDIVDISAQSALVTISGFAGSPQSARKTQGNQFFFVNGRFFRSPYLHKAVMNAYSDLVPDGVTPSYILFLETDPHSVDVNISPTKSEVKFEEESAVFQAVYASIRSILGKNSFGASIDFDAESSIQMPEIGRSFAEYRADTINPSPDFDPSYNPFDVTPGASWSNSAAYHTNTQGIEKLFPQQPENNYLAESRPGRDIVVVKGRYIALEGASGLMIINARRAMERILYEKALRTLQNSEEHISQQVMFPVQIQVGPAPRLLFDQNRELLCSLGFDIQAIGSDTIAVGGIPEGFDSTQTAIQDIVGDLMGLMAVDTSALPELMRSTLAGKFSAMAARHLSPIANKSQAQSLLDRLFECDNSELTPTGAKIAWIIGSEELEKRF